MLSIRSLDPIKSAVLGALGRAPAVGGRACYDMDRKLRRFLPRNGYYIEAGAHNGTSQSNTYYLEQQGWKGLLVEPIPELYERCRVDRPTAVVCNYALVSADYAEKTVLMRYGHLMSFVRGALSSDEEVAHIAEAKRWHQCEEREVPVPARTLGSLLGELSVAEVDFLSLDVEGYELQVLRGLEIRRHRPAFILVECLTPARHAEIRGFLESNSYREVKQLSPRDYLFRFAGRSRW
jgi:FkbM family methyltransferase